MSATATASACRHSHQFFAFRRLERADFSAQQFSVVAEFEATAAELENFEVMPQSKTSVTSTASVKHGNMPASSGSDLQARNQENHEVIPSEDGPGVVSPIVGRGCIDTWRNQW
ncbi:hypothetical protein Droror1_Dr00008546 [Drosera rotundifolia]